MVRNRAALFTRRGDAEEAKEWTPELIKRQFIESPDSMTEFQKHLAAHPGHWFSMTDIAAAQNAAKGRSRSPVRLARTVARTANRYAMKTWPFEFKWNHVEGQQYYSMTPEVAKIIETLQRARPEGVISVTEAAPSAPFAEASPISPIHSPIAINAEDR